MALDFVEDPPGNVTWLSTLLDRVEWWQNWLLGKNASRHATIDFETRSACDLRKHGSWLYSKHPSTEVMCLAYELPGMDDVELWHMAHPDQLIDESPMPTELFAFVLAGGLVEAHNAMFERVIWTHVCHERMGWPLVPPAQWRCSASRASMCSLPRDLEGACKAMGLDVEKDMEGRRLMLKMSKPRKPRKAELEEWKAAGEPLLWWEEEDELERLWAYCKQDVRAEHALSEVLPRMDRKVLELWQLDQEVNWRGTRFDLQMAKAALDIAASNRKRLNSELFDMTGVTAATKRQQVKDWLSENEGVDLPDTTAVTLEKYIDGKFADDISARARRVLEIVRDVNKTSTRKYQAALDKTDPDDWRARDLLMYHGANTGRWSGKGIQVHNFPRGNSKNDVYFDKKKRKWVATFNMDLAAEEIKAGDEDYIHAFYDGGVMEALSSGLRGLIIPSEGHDIMVADYSAIEARCVLWEAGEDRALEVFRTGGDIYCDMATGIYGYEVNKADHPAERQFGKQAILGLGYGMGWITFLITCKKYKISFSVEQVRGILGPNFDKYMDWVENQLFPKQRHDESDKAYTQRRRTASKNRRKLTDADIDPRASVHELALMKYTVDVYRSRYPKVKQMWSDQEAAAMEAVELWQRELAALVALEGNEIRDMLMPRGESHLLEDLQTPYGQRWMQDNMVEGPQVACGKTTWQCVGGFLCCFLPSGRPLRYRTPFLKLGKTAWGQEKMGLRYMSVVTGGKWARTSTYGGKIVENITQAVARDIMSDALLRMRGGIYRFLISVHDEIVCEVPKGQGSVEEFEREMAGTEPWAAGCPVEAEGDRIPRYRK